MDYTKTLCPHCGRASFTPHPPAVCAAILEDAWIQAQFTVQGIEGQIERFLGAVLLAGEDVGTLPDRFQAGRLLPPIARLG